MNIITRFDDGKGDKAVFVRLKNGKKIIPDEVNIVVVLPKKMKVLKGKNKILTALVEGVVANLPGQPQVGVTIIKGIIGHSATIGQGTKPGTFSGEIKCSAEVSSFFPF